MLVLLAPAGLSWLPSAPSAQADSGSVRFGPIPVRGDCRAYPGQACTWDAWTGETTVSPRIIREGETLAVNVSICCGAVSYQLPELSGCTHREEQQQVEVKGKDGIWVLQEQSVRVGSTCSWKPGPTRGSWATIAASITGPCGSQIAVQEGRAEFAACGSATDSDYFGVIPKEEELWAISGRFSAADNRRLGGILVELSGSERQAAVTTAAGDYAFLVGKGSYTVTTEEGFCASVDGSPVSGCSRTASISVPGSHSVDFRPEKEGTLKGTVYDAKGKGLAGVTVSAVGKMGQSVATDGNGAYTMTLVAGSYQVTAAGAWRAGTDAQGKPSLIRPVYCSSPIGDCEERVSVTIKGDDETSIDWRDRGIVGTPADEPPSPDNPPGDPSIDLDNPATIDLWFLASVLVAGGAAVAGAGAAAGGGGSGGGGGGGPDRPWSEMTEEEKERYRSWFIERWKDAHPNASGEQLTNLIKLLYDQPDSFWERSLQSAKDLGLAYGEDVSSGDQAEGLLNTFEGMASNFIQGGKDLLALGERLGSGALNELDQLPATLREFPAIFGDDLASGAARDRLAGMLDYGSGALDLAGKWLSDPAAMKDAIATYGSETVDKFMSKARELDKALMNADPLVIRQRIGEIAGTAEFETLLGGLGDKGLHYLADIKNAAKVEEAVDGIRTATREIEVAGVTPEVLARREELLKQVASGQRVKLTMDEATELIGIDRRLLVERQGTILQYSEGAAEEGAFTVYKVSGDAESALTSQQLREQFPELYTGKANAVADKGFVSGEDFLMSEADKAKLAENPIRPGETVNYTPRELSQAEIDGLSPELRDRYYARLDQADSWEAYETFANRKTVDLTDPASVEKYGEMWVAEDPSAPAQAAEFWKDPADNKLYVRYQTADGQWHGPKLQASDVDTVTHGGGSGLTYEQSTDLQYKQAFGQLGEGDTPKWAMSMLEQTPDGGYALKEGADPAMLVKAIDQLRKAEQQPVLTQSLDGLYLESVKYPELEYATKAAQTIDWDPSTAQLLQGWGVLP